MAEAACALPPQTRPAPNVCPHAIRQTTTSAPANDGGSPAFRSSVPVTANTPGSLMLFQAVSIQTPERWICEMWKLVDMAVEGIGDAAHMPSMPTGAEFRSVSLIGATGCRETETLVVGAGVLVIRTGMRRIKVAMTSACPYQARPPPSPARPRLGSLACLCQAQLRLKPEPRYAL